MKIEIIRSEYIVGIGHKNVGEIIECNEELGRSLIYRGLAREKRIVKRKEGVEEE